jgi:hypothetical protein
MYHLLSGQLPFKGESSMDCIVARITGQAVRISEVRPGLPPRLVQTIEKLMATDPADRYQTADEAAAALRSLLRPKNAPPARSAPTAAAVASVPEPVPKGGTTLEAPLPPVPAGIRPSKRRGDSLRSRWAGRRTKVIQVLAGVAVAAVALFVVAMMLFRSSVEDRPPSQEGTVPPTKVPIVTTGGPDDRKSSSVTESPKPGAAVSPRQDLAGPTRPAARPDVGRSSLVIENPKQGATVGMREELTGRIESQGWPVIFVQADIPGQPWWCQAPVATVDGGRFSTQVVFGDEFTPPGTKFRIAGIISRSREEALKFEIGSKQQALPEGFPRSAEVVVMHR